jgi:hypothetical protein
MRTVPDLSVLKKALVVLTICLAIAACGTPVPADKAAYIGRWESRDMLLLISQSGSVQYKRREGTLTKSVNGPLKGFKGDNFEVGVGPMSTTFVVSAPPHLVGDLTKMTVDGVELTRAQ